MSINKSGDENVQTHTEAYYEELAGQEVIYLEEQEERARAVLISEEPSPFGCKQLSLDRELVQAERSMADPNSSRRIAESRDEELGHAAEELVTGDSDDPPLSEEAVVETLRTS